MADTAKRARRGGPPKQPQNRVDHRRVQGVAQVLVDDQQPGMDNPREDSYGDDANEAENPGRARFQAEDHPIMVRGIDLNGYCLHFGKGLPGPSYRSAGPSFDPAINLRTPT